MCFEGCSCGCLNLQVILMLVLFKIGKDKRVVLAVYILRSCLIRFEVRLDDTIDYSARGYILRYRIVLLDRLLN
jgi:hypothetical protein